MSFDLRPLQRALALGAMAALLFSAGPIAGAESGRGEAGGLLPLPVRAATLTQRGRNLLWEVQMSRPIVPALWRREGRTLCLALARVSHPLLGARLCLAPPARRRSRALLLSEPLTGAGSRGARVIGARLKIRGATLSALFRPAVIAGGYRSLSWQVQSGLEPGRCGQAATPPATTSSTLPGTGAPPGANESCAVLFPARAAVAPLHRPRVVACRADGDSYVLSGSNDRRLIALSFDDGPWKDPPSIDFVRLLARLHVPATFFEIGDQIGAEDPDGSVERSMLQAGDMIGDHTWSHPLMTALAPALQRSQLLRTAAAIHRASGFEPCLWRAPYGAVDRSLIALARSLELLTIGWDVDTRDWSLPGTSTIAERAISGARGGAIVLMHFGGGPRRQTLAALPEIVGALRRRGHRFVTITDLLGLRLIYR